MNLLHEGVQDLHLGKRSLAMNHLVPLRTPQPTRATYEATLAVVNFARITLDLAFDLVKDEVDLGELRRQIDRDSYLSRVTSVCFYNPDLVDVDVNTLFDLPFFQAELKRVDAFIGLLNDGSVRLALSTLTQHTNNPFLSNSRAVIISVNNTRLACVKVARRSQVLFITYNPQTEGIGLIGNMRKATFFSENFDEVVQHIEKILQNSKYTTTTPGLSDLQFSCLVLEHTPERLRFSEAAEQAILDASFRLLALLMETKRLREVNAKIHVENNNLRNTIAERSALQRRQIEERDYRAGVDATRRQGSTVKDHKSTRGSSPKQSGSSERHFLSTWEPTFPPPQPEIDLDELRSVALAEQLTREFEEEDKILRKQAAELSRTTQAIFECSICMEEVPEDSVALMDGCQHSFCRACIRGYIVSKIDERRYPIPCPVCMMDKKNEYPGLVSGFLVETIGINEDKFRIYEELQLTKHSIPVECRRCKHTIFVDRAEFEAATVVYCPLPTCQYRWCKGCQQAVDPEEEEHSCDGSREMRRLMKAQRWMYCPGCNTPTERTTGCNHMTCRVPSCNTHFCYVCGSQTDTSGGHHCRGQQP